MELVEPESAVVRVGRSSAGVCRTKLSCTVRQRSDAWRYKTRLCHPGGTTDVLPLMVMPYHSEHRWNRIGAMCAKDIYQFRDILVLHYSGPKV